MFKLEDYNVYVCRDKVDFRKSISGLSAIVKFQMNLDPRSKSLFLFRNQRRDKIKILYWDNTGFALWYKVLDKEKFPWPLEHKDKTVYISADQLAWLLKGIDYWSLKEHKKIFYENAC